MSLAINKAKSDVLSEVKLVTIAKINNLEELWSSMYEDDIVKNYIYKLTDHIEKLYNEIAEETVDRKEQFLEKIAVLKNEKERLLSLLRLDKNDDDDDQEQKNSKRLFQYQMYLEDEIKNLKIKLSDFQDKINQLNSNENSICNELAIKSQNLPIDPLPINEEIKKFECRLQNLEIECSDRRINYKNLIEQIENLALLIKIDLNEDKAYSNIKSFQTPGYLSVDNLEMLTKYWNNVVSYKNKLADEICLKKEKLTILFDCLEISPSKRAAFLELNENTKVNSDILNDELERCEKLKRQNIKKFVDKTREQIKEFWDKTMKSIEEREKFVQFSNNCYTEDLLTLHEMELKDLKIFYAENLLIFQKFNEHKTLWERFQALEEKEKQPGRYQNRGGQLLLEEKERRSIKLKFPKILAVITKMVTEYEKKYNRKFLVWGRNIEDIISEDYSNHLDTKEKQASARKAALAKSKPVTPHSITKQRSLTFPMKKIASNTKINTIGSNNKPKIEIKPSTTSGSSGAVKRNILGDLNNQPKILITPASPFKNNISKANSHKFIKPKSVTKVRVISALGGGASLNRRSTSGRQNSSSRHNSSKRKRSILAKKKLQSSDVLVSNTSSSSSSSSSTSLQTESLINYNDFEDHIAKTRSCRSSELPEAESTKIMSSRKKLSPSQKQKSHLTSNQVKSLSDSKLRRSIRNSLISPAIRRSPSPRNRKNVTPTNVPFII